MAAALAARDYEGADRAEIDAWFRPLLQAATTEDDDIVSRTGTQLAARQLPPSAMWASIAEQGILQRVTRYLKWPLGKIIRSCMRSVVLSAKLPGSTTAFHAP
jgi:hypothetical protein